MNFSLQTQFWCNQGRWLPSSGLNLIMVQVQNDNLQGDKKTAKTQLRGQVYLIALSLDERVAKKKPGTSY